MRDLQTIIKELYDSILDLDDAAFQAKVRADLKGYSPATVLIAIFRTFENGLSGALLANLGFWFEQVTYQDIMIAMLDLGMSDFPAYHFAAYIPEILGVDIIQAARMIQQHTPEHAHCVQRFANYRQLIGPSRERDERLREYGADVEKLRASLRASGAPLLPTPATG